MDLMSKFCKKGELALSTCAGTFVTAKACLQLLENRRLIGCKKNSACFLSALLSLMDVYTK